MAAPVVDYVAALDGSVAGLRIGVDRTNTLGRPGTDPGLAALFDAAIAELEAGGATIVDIAIPYFDALSDVAMLTCRPRCCRSSGPTSSRGGRLRLPHPHGDGVRRAVERGRSGARRPRASGRSPGDPGAHDELALDTIVTPTAAAGAPLVEGTDLAAVVGLVLTPIWNATGFPALSVPMGLGASGLPIGLQIVTKPFEDALALRIGDAYQRRTSFHLELPPMVAAIA